MKSIGNDIVALNAIDIQRSNNPAYYSKFVTGAELPLYSQKSLSKLPLAHFIWLLWSVKESAYKYLKRIDEELIFAPVKIIVHSLVSPQKPTTSLTSDWQNDDDFYSGQVIYGIEKLFFHTKITEQFIATVACDEPLFNNIYWEVNTIDDTSITKQSTDVREFALKKIRAITKQEHPQIVKTAAGVPVIFNSDVQSDIPISLAHHSNFVSYAFYYSSLKV